jgi:mRNA-degrading endonuclease YafQ of YafQ-DinJ toxin-antitoxin module
MYEIISSKKFDKLYQKMVRKNRWLETRYLQTIKRMKNNPFDPVLNTYKAITRHFGKANSSRVTGDLRII